MSGGEEQQQALLVELERVGVEQKRLLGLAKRLSAAQTRLERVEAQTAQLARETDALLGAGQEL